MRGWIAFVHVFGVCVCVCVRRNVRLQLAYLFVILALYELDFRPERLAQHPDHVAKPVEKRVPEVLFGRREIQWRCGRQVHRHS